MSTEEYDDDVRLGSCHECDQLTDIAWDYLCYECREREDADLRDAIANELTVLPDGCEWTVVDDRIIKAGQ